MRSVSRLHSGVSCRDPERRSNVIPSYGGGTTLMPSAPDATALWQPPGVGYSVVKEGRGMNARGGAQLPDESVISGLDRKKTSQLLQ
eukprot:scaffold233370_cov35-Tisochrysis_lutea.AAC.3